MRFQDVPRGASVFIDANFGEVRYVAEPKALQYRESQTMSDADYEFIEKTVEAVAGDGLGALGED